MARGSLRKYKQNLTERFQVIQDVCDKIQSVQKPASKVLSLDDDIELLNKLVSDDEPSAAYKAQEENIIKGLKSALTDKFNIEAQAAAWPEMPENEKRSLLKKILKVQASLQSTQEIKVRAARLKVKKMDITGSMNYNIEDKLGKRDRITIAERVFNKSLSNVLNTLTHEQTHIHQIALARAVNFKLINQNNPLYRDGLYYLLKDENHAYVSSSIYEPYTRQRDEVEAYLVGDAIGDFAAQFETECEASPKQPEQVSPGVHAVPLISPFK